MSYSYAQILLSVVCSVFTSLVHLFNKNKQQALANILNNSEDIINYPKHTADMIICTHSKIASYRLLGMTAVHHFGFKKVCVRACVVSSAVSCVQLL